MSIILKGIDMPKDGKPIRLVITSGGDVVEVWRDGLEKAYHRDSAVQIPKQHGNLKDENEIIKRLEEKEEEPLYQHDTDDWWVGIIDAETVVYTSPTILEEEE